MNPDYSPKSSIYRSRDDYEHHHWLYSESTRTPTFQAFLDSLETRAVRRAKVKPDKPARPAFGNFATWRG